MKAATSLHRLAICRALRLGARLGQLLAFAAALSAPFAHAQFELKSGEFNRLFGNGVPFSPTNTPPLQAGQPQFAGVTAVPGGSAARSLSGSHTERYPSQVYLSPSTGLPTGQAYALTSSSIGVAFAVGVPRYFMGDIITPPTTQADGVTPADPFYWRPQPVAAGEVIQHHTGLLETPIPAGSALSYYYSPHAEKVFASQSGRVTVLWVTRVPVNGLYRFKEEIFSVSAATEKPTRTIFWTERSFNAPAIGIPTGSIQTVNPIYNNLVPAQVDEEYQMVGINPNPNPNTAPPPELRTIWFQKLAGIGELRAYNVEGRILVEYLGNLKPGTLDTFEFLGADVVDIVRSAPVTNVTVELGERLLPRDSSGRILPLDGSQELIGEPVMNASPDSQGLYGTVVRANGMRHYFAEKENGNPDSVVFYWLERRDAAISLLTPPAEPNLGIFWPVVRNHYQQVWPATLEGFDAHYTVGENGSSTATGIHFLGGQLPEIVFQDDPDQSEAAVDINSQRLIVSVPGDGFNRSLLKFTSGNEIWYIRLHTQADGRDGFYESDGLPAINATGLVGQRINPPADTANVQYARAGYIAGGTGYHPGAYRNPFELSVEAAESGAIIPVNAVPGDNELRVWWFQRISPPSSAFQPLYIPSKVGRYTISYPSGAPQIVLASNAGSGDLSPAELAGSLYVQNDRALPGFNPNEEHALLIGGRIYALRDDLNNTSSSPADYTSQAFALLSYTSPADQRPAMSVFRVVREVNVSGSSNNILFDYPVTAGTVLQAPMPLPLLPLPVDSTGSVLNAEVGNPDTAHSAPAELAPLYSRFTFQDRKGYHWVYRGPHATGAPSFGMQFYYSMREGFFIPGLATQPPVGTILPYLRTLSAGVPVGDPVSGTPLTITYRPVWPSSAPELRVAETLTLPKFGLPSVLNQASAHVLYQQSIAQLGAARPSVVLHDPFRDKIFRLGEAGSLASLPASVRTSEHHGKTYFQGLPPHLQQRFFFDPLRGTKGALVLTGEFIDVPAGEDYVHLNVLSAEDLASLHNLVAPSDPNRQLWIGAINGLLTRVETFIPDPLKADAYIASNSAANVSAEQLAVISNSDTAVADYALTATGSGSGWVTMIFGNGRAFTPAGDPVVMKVFRVSPQLYTGDLKVLLPSNPLDEKVTLRHSGDFAARPQDYEFQWRYAPPQGGGAPMVYSFALAERSLGNWQFAQNPEGPLPSAAEYSAGTTAALPRSVTVNDANYAADSGLPGLGIRSVSGVDFTTGIPAQIVFSAEVNSRTGFVVYVNGSPALAFDAPSYFNNVNASTGLAPTGLARQFYIDPNYFQRGVNNIEVALYATSDPGIASTINFRLHASSETDLVVASGSPWLTPNGTLLNQAIIGGSPTAPLGSPLLVMSDNYFTMRYRPKAGVTNVAGSTWSRWMPPMLVEGWIKRVLAAVNPFNQRMTDLYNNAVNTDVSLLTQAGSRWEGDIALTLSNIDSFGLIEIYETLLNRAKEISINSGFNYAPANDALLLAAGYLNDLYTILGNEAFADAANPTISIDDSTTVTEVNTSRFSFEGQVKSLLEEELALLRGRDDFLAPGTAVAPAYNRLYWNFTRGINSGEALYAVNYNIREKAGSSTANGVLDAADAQRMFPQGHGDAYGHYLTALKGYYRLLTNPNFTWTPRPEAVTVLGQPVQVDYFDERKFAAAAANVARTAIQVIGLTHRQAYHDDPSAGWSHFRDGAVNPATGVARHWGLDEWTSRTTQGAYLNWVVGNALLPDVDNTPGRSGIQIIDRSTVPDLAELTIAAEATQSAMDNANAHLNPLGLSPGAIAFDISPAELKAGKSHYEQIHERALRAVLNAKGAFDQAATMTRLLRNQENQIDDYNAAIVDQERAFVRQLIELYGSPYAGDIGPGKTYADGYTGPDDINWFVIDRASNLVDVRSPVELTVRVPTNVRTFSSLSVDDINQSYLHETQLRTIYLQPNQFAQFSDTWAGAGNPLGSRRVVGSLQQALADSHQAHVSLMAAQARHAAREDDFLARGKLFSEMLFTHINSLAADDAARSKIADLAIVQGVLLGSAELAKSKADSLKNAAGSVIEFMPQVNGLANDMTSSFRGSIKAVSVGASTGLSVYAALAKIAAKVVESEQNKIRKEADVLIRDYGFNYQQAQVAYEYQRLFNEMLLGYYEIDQLATDYQRSLQRLTNLIAEGDRIKAEREIFRQRAASLIQGYRTKDLTFRTFRNEALEQYRSLYDLAARYSYLAAKSYDYETGLLGSPAGLSVINGIVASRSLGDLTGGEPQATVSTLGDSGLAGTMARLQADWSVVKGRLGINNPDTYGTLFSLRRELFRLMNDPNRSDDDVAWQQILQQHIVSDLLSDPDAAAYCNNLRKPDGSPVPGIVIPFSTTIEHGRNFFGLPLAAGDHAYSPSSHATKIFASGLVLRGYIGMDPYAIGTPGAGTPVSTDPNALSATPYVYLVPVGTDYQLAPALGNPGTVRGWNVRDQALPLPFNLGATAFSSTQFFDANGTLREQPWILRRHQAFRPVDDPAYFYSSMPAEFTNSRLVGRSVWNSRWKLIIPAYTLLHNEQDGLNRFVVSVKDIELFLRTYSHSGN
jgi:hypothetical protein